jgi:hypothetical protein
VGTYPVGSGAGAITFDGSHIWATSGGDTVVEIDDPQS